MDYVLGNNNVHPHTNKLLIGENSRTTSTQAFLLGNHLLRNAFHNISSVQGIAYSPSKYMESSPITPDFKFQRTMHPAVTVLVKLN